MSDLHVGMHVEKKQHKTHPFPRSLNYFLTSVVSHSWLFCICQYVQNVLVKSEACTVVPVLYILCVPHSFLALLLLFFKLSFLVTAVEGSKVKTSFCRR